MVQPGHKEQCVISCRKCFSPVILCNGLNCKEGQNIKAPGMRSSHADCVASANCALAAGTWRNKYYQTMKTVGGGSLDDRVTPLITFGT